MSRPCSCGCGCLLPDEPPAECRGSVQWRTVFGDRSLWYYGNCRCAAEDGLCEGCRVKVDVAEGAP